MQLEPTMSCKAVSYVLPLTKGCTIQVDNLYYQIQPLAQTPSWGLRWVYIHIIQPPGLLSGPDAVRFLFLMTKSKVICRKSQKDLIAAQNDQKFEA